MVYHQASELLEQIYRNEQPQNYETDSETSKSESESSESELEMEDSADSSEDSSEDEENESHILNAHEPLYPGAPINVAECILAIFTLAVRFKITGVLLSSILELISLICAQPNNCIKTLYKLKKIFKNKKSPIIRHYFCSTCYSKLENSYCDKCKIFSKTYFLELPILSQLTLMFKRPNF